MHRHTGHTGHVDTGFTFILKISPAIISSKRRGVGSPKKRALKSHRVGGAFSVLVQPRWWRSIAASLVLEGPNPFHTNALNPQLIHK